MKKLIERMKNNRVPNYLLTDEEFECLESVGYRDLEYYKLSVKAWHANITFIEKRSITVYRIRPDYQPEPEPEIIKCEIYGSGTSDATKLYFRYNNNSLMLYKAIGFAGFKGFEFADGTVNHMSFWSVVVNSETGRVEFERAKWVRLEGK
jgi:hypothetical protein